MEVGERRKLHDGAARRSLRAPFRSGHRQVIDGGATLDRRPCKLHRTTQVPHRANRDYICLWMLLLENSDALLPLEKLKKYEMNRPLCAMRQDGRYLATNAAPSLFCGEACAFCALTLGCG